MRLDETDRLVDEYVDSLATTDRFECGEHKFAYSVEVCGVTISEWSTRREAERHASRIRKALKGER